jgi:single-strand DNA-binding protein
MINKVILLGRIGRELELRYTQSQLAIVTFSLATSEKIKNEQKTEWHNVVAFGLMAENLVKYCGKGSLVFVDGKIQQKTFTKKDGSKGYSTDIIANSIQFVETKKANTVEQMQAEIQSTIDEVDENIPF